MIRGTNADCKVLGITTVGTTATVSLLVFATVTTYPAKAFTFHVQNSGSTETTRLDNNVYWVDKNNNYDYDARNVDTNKYAEIRLHIDITDGEKSQVSNGKWLRKCTILMMSDGKVAWSSGELSLISEEFEIPEIRYVGFSDENQEVDAETETKRAHIGTRFDLRYETKRNFSYDASNFDVEVRFRTIGSNALIERKAAYPDENNRCHVVSDLLYDYGTQLKVEIVIADKTGAIHRKYERIYRIRKKHSNSFVKEKDGVKRVVAFFIHTPEKEEHEGEWLWES